MSIQRYYKKSDLNNQKISISNTNNKRNNSNSKISLLSKLIKEDDYKLEKYVDYDNEYHLEEDNIIINNINQVENKCSECPNIPNFPPMNTPPDSYTKLAYLNIIAHRSLGNDLNNLG